MGIIANTPKINKVHRINANISIIINVHIKITRTSIGKEIKKKCNITIKFNSSR